MKFAVSWLNDWVDVPVTPAKLAARLTQAGLEVDAVEVDGAGIEDVLVAEVLAVEKHPDADRLKVCSVSRGAGEPLEIVCGAPNVVAGMKTPLALPGTRLPDGTKLRRSKIRGVVSNGMLCSAIEIGLGTESDGILALPADAPVGQPLVEFLGLPDTVIDVDITPNRGDCFSVLGIARDVAALTGQKLKQPAMQAVAAAIDDIQAVERPVPAACPRFAHRLVRNIDGQARSPLWMTERLRKSGLRAIHPVVDVTNYVMLELGQPLHAYDHSRLSGCVRPRYAVQGESVKLLDEREVTLSPDTVVISDDSGVIGLAGIMGGYSTMVTEHTRDVFFEAAFWPQNVMAGRARSYGMHTDASVRFERGVDPSGQARAVERAVELLVMIAGGEAGPLVDDVDESLLPQRQPVALSRARLDRVLGTSVPANQVHEILEALGLAPERSGDDWVTHPPSHRFDIVIEEDLVEEVARVFGYDNIPPVTASAALPLAPVSETSVDADQVANTLVARDYQEVITYSFVDAELDKQVTGEATSLVLSNPISSEMSVMRASLWPGMLQVAAGNVARQQERVRIFELGRTYHGATDKPLETLRIAGLVLGPRVEEQWASGSQKVDFFDLKADVEALLSLSCHDGELRFVAVEHGALQVGQSAEIFRGDESLGLIGKVHPPVAKTFELKNDIFVFELDVEKSFATLVPTAQTISKYPAIRRDLAFVVDESVVAADMIAAAQSVAPELIRQVTVFDVYRGEGIEAGRKSIALGLILQETSRTLTDVDADRAIDAALQKIQQEFNADLRE